MSKEIGYAVERQARDYLTARGLNWITSNYSCRCGEIDLVMKDSQYLVFVEVRARVSPVYGGALASITQGKIKKIIKTAKHYLTVNKLHDKYPVRFDVISVQGHSADIEWIKNAFGIDY
ncbi:YraN family protein [Legionella dresdenensis]|uniref:UPF0102 protein ACFORL_03875 n=1 Tax=Legionella dresdenensis TaxID=450200 RepID=A0ABV8CE45_9GAMM